MQSSPKPRRLLLWLLSPFVLVFFIGSAIYKVCIGWWFDPFRQRRSNATLEKEVRSTFDFLFPEGQFVAQNRAKPLPFDLATVTVRWNNVLLYITRGRGSEIVSSAPVHAAEDSHELGLAIAAAERRHYSEGDLYRNFLEAAKLLRPRLVQLNRAFSKGEFEKIKNRL